jgi:hypothetical protein
MTQPFDNRDWDLRTENERLKDKICGLEKLNQMTDEEVVMELKRRLQYLKEALQRQDNATIELKSLLTRAADALEEEFGYCIPPRLPTKEQQLIAELRKGALIDELRKAAE